MRKFVICHPDKYLEYIEADDKFGFLYSDDGGDGSPTDKIINTGNGWKIELFGGRILELDYPEAAGISKLVRAVELCSENPANHYESRMFEIKSCT